MLHSITIGLVFSEVGTDEKLFENEVV